MWQTIVMVLDIQHKGTDQHSFPQVPPSPTTRILPSGKSLIYHGTPEGKESYRQESGGG